MKYVQKIFVLVFTCLFGFGNFALAQEPPIQKQTQGLVSYVDVHAKEHGVYKTGDRLKFKSLDTGTGKLFVFEKKKSLSYISDDLKVSFYDEDGDGIPERYFSFPQGKQSRRLGSRPYLGASMVQSMLWKYSYKEIKENINLFAFEGQKLFFLGEENHILSSKPIPGKWHQAKVIDKPLSSIERKEVINLYQSKIRSLYKKYYGGNDSPDNQGENKDDGRDEEQGEEKKDPRLRPKRVDFSFNSEDKKHGIFVENSDPENYTGQWGIQVVGRATRGDTKTPFVYRSKLVLVLHQEGTDNYEALCSYDEDSALTFNVNTSVCGAGGKKFIVVPWLKTDKGVSLYFAETLKGEALSGKYSLPEGSIKEAIITPDIVIQNVRPVQKGTKRFFEVRFDVTATRKGERIEVLIYDVNGKRVGSLGDAFYQKAQGYVLPQRTTNLAQIKKIISGSRYSLHFVDSKGNDIIPSHSIENTIFEPNKKRPGGGITGAGGVYSEKERTTIKEVARGGLVGSDRCGYGLGDQNNRMCGFNDFMYMINKIISYIMVLVLPIAALVFAYAGYLYLTSGGNTNKRSAAKNAMTNLVIGVLIILCAWVVVRAVLLSLGVTDEFFIFFKK